MRNDVTPEHGDEFEACNAPAMAGTQAIFYRDTRGPEPVSEFIEALPAKRAAKIDAYVEEYLSGQEPGAPPPEFPITSQIEGELRELRVRFANTRYRLLYKRSGNLIILLHAFEKNTGAVPVADKELAKQRMIDFKRRMDAKPRRPPRAAGQDAPMRRRVRD
jgi:phage-related protein